MSSPTSLVKYEGVMAWVKVTPLSQSGLWVMVAALPVQPLFTLLQTACLRIRHVRDGGLSPSPFSTSSAFMGCIPAPSVAGTEEVSGHRCHHSARVELGGGELPLLGCWSSELPRSSGCHVLCQSEMSWLQT